VRRVNTIRRPVDGKAVAFQDAGRGDFSLATIEKKDGPPAADFSQPRSACDIHSFGATAARAFEALTAVEPEPPAPVAQPAPAAPRQRAGALTPEMVKRMADRAEAASKRK
jgi:hypothetical protein